MRACTTSAVAPPSVNDDASKGYSAGSMWIDTVARLIYLCSDATPGMAEWKDVSPDYSAFLRAANNLADLTDVVAARANLGLGNVPNLKGNLEANRDPQAGDDAAAGYAVGSLWINTASRRTFVCVRSQPGAAVWQLLTAGLSANPPATNGSYTNSNISAWR